MSSVVGVGGTRREEDSGDSAGDDGGRASELTTAMAGLSLSALQASTGFGFGSDSGMVGVSALRVSGCADRTMPVSEDWNAQPVFKGVAKTVVCVAGAAAAASVVAAGRAATVGSKTRLNSTRERRCCL